ncbi:type 1 periplasmic-binding domain-containing protein [Actinacidiphila yeochonensis]|uniref:amino acid ABC transporter substrate-binding protein n=1 Tax=Actinacidiphila yeochonensis TaxID=89050 RepID=UPI00055A29B4|nr:amino acid ABC transporter substrate-binding protein [Actinacidiphila yeochonensis]
MSRPVPIRPREPFRVAYPAVFWTALAVVLGVVAAAAVYVTRQHAPVYVTDGSHVFNSNIAGVEKKIRAENALVTASGGKYVTIAVMETMTPDPKAEPLDPNRTRHALEGAYLDQYRTNHPNGPTGRLGTPLVKLVLADEGSLEKTAPQAVAKLEKMTGAPDHLVAVTGLGISVAATDKAVADLGRAGIGMVGAVVSGDKLDGAPGFVRVAPTNSDQAAAAVGFLDSHAEGGAGSKGKVNVWLVQDQNSKDDYARSLATSFQRAMRTSKRLRFVGRGTVYDSALGDPQSALGQVGSSVCDAGTDVVYFAGRGVDLPGLLRGVANRYCAAQRKLLVITGSDATQLVNQQNLWAAKGTDMEVYYTALAHPGMWSGPHPQGAAPAVADFTDYPGFAKVFPDEPSNALDDAWAIMYHDAFETAVQSVVSQWNGRVPEPGAVANQLYGLSVNGASGYLCFDSAHDPIDKVIPIVRMDAQGKPTFSGLSSATGAPPSGDPCHRKATS